MNASGTKLASPQGKRIEHVKPRRPLGLLVALLVFGCLIGFLMISYRLSVKPPEITPVPEQTETEAVGTVEPDPEGNDPAGAADDTPEPALARKEDFYTVLIVGTDRVASNTDVIMVASLDNLTKQVHVVNIPRDTLVNVDRSVKKINAAYAYGGMENLKAEVASLIGFTPDSEVLVDLTGFEKLIDAVGGVEFDVPIDMYYDDPSQDLSIHFKKGLQFLDGKAALEVVRFRRNNDGTGYIRQDLDRIHTTQRLMSAVAKQLLRPAMLLKLNALANIAAESLETNLSLGEILWFAERVMGIESAEEQIAFHTFSEHDGFYEGLSYVFAEEAEALELINSTINPYTTDLTDLDILAPSN